MKKYLLTALILIIASTSAFSQVKVRPGIKAGFNASTITNVENSSRKIGFDGGMFVNIQFAGFYQMQVETTYSNQGVSADGYDYYEPYTDSYVYVDDGDLNLHYITLGVANKFFVAPGTGFHLIIGPSIDINVSDDDYWDITPADLSFFGGIGYEFPTGLGIEIRYKQGIIDIRDGYADYADDYDMDYYNSDSKLNAALQVGLFYKFNF